MKRQNGNALWLILIAIFLLGGLTALLSRTSTTTEDTGNSERMRILASQVLQQGASIEAAVQNLLSTGCSENQISFWRDTNNDGAESASDNNYNPDAPANRSCHVFAAKGGGVAWKSFPALGTSGTGITMTQTGFGFRGIGTDNLADLYLVILSTPAVLNGFCTAVNQIMGVPKTGGVPPGVFDPREINAMQMGGAYFTGTFPTLSTLVNHPAANKKAFCVGMNVSLTIFLYPVMPR